jgi:threonyl-tRNA synthetase
LTHGPPHENGYYYDSFIGEKKVTKKDYSLIEDEMKKIID